ncbi:hypothetical protein DRP05_07425 [Archaeoglobales archaeon]|nr:MAG: hypothetical protein DRP05_07425 [Archaeoglobales archaeon]
MVDEIERVITKAAIVALCIGTIVASYLIWVNAQESYSALYLYPETYKNYVDPSNLPTNVSFVYGIKSYEIKETTYSVNVYLGDLLMKSKKIVLKSGEVFEENESIKVPKGTKFPIKVRIVAEANGNVYEVHFWLKEIPKV